MNQIIGVLLIGLSVAWSFYFGVQSFRKKKIWFGAPVGRWFSFSEDKAGYVWAVLFHVGWVAGIFWVGLTFLHP